MFRIKYQKLIKSGFSAFWRMMLSLALIAAILWFGLSVPNTQAQKDDKWQMNPNSVSQPDTTEPTRMPARSLSEFRKIAAQEKNEIYTAKAGTNTAQNSAAANPIIYVILNVEFRTPETRKAVFSDAKTSAIPGATVLTVTDRFADVFVQTDAAWTAIEKSPGFVAAEESGRVEVPPPPDAEISPVIAEAVPEKIVRGGYRDSSGKLLTGKNVIIAIVDTGVDFRHPDFITYDSTGKPTSRLLALWDTSIPYQAGRGSRAPFSFPNRTSIGTLFTQEQLTAELRSTTPRIPATDLDGHGTACASVAAGNGNGYKGKDSFMREAVLGVAPQADIIAVRMGVTGFENGWVKNAIGEWLDNIASANKKPVIFSGSFEGHGTGHDGQSIEERHLSARFAPDRAGRALVIAAGNQGASRIHAEASFSGQDNKKLIMWQANRPTIIKVYFDNNDPGLRIGSARTIPINKDTVKFKLNPITNQYQATVSVPPGAGGMWLYNLSGKQTTAHAYFVNRKLGAFDASVAKFSTLVGSPGTADNTITVGSYDWNNNFLLSGRAAPIELDSVCAGINGSKVISIGWLSCYSSPGPRRDGKRKPEIVAPGQWFPASYAKVLGKGGAPNWDVDATGNYVAMNGTSAATPYTAGIIALMFEKQPTLTFGQVKRLLVSKAGKSNLNPFGSTALPNNNWGYGKLDYEAVKAIFDEIK